MSFFNITFIRFYDVTVFVPNGLICEVGHHDMSVIIYNNKANLRDLIAATGLVISNWIQIVDFSVTVRKRLTRVKIRGFLSRVTLKFDEWHWKTIWHLFYLTLSFVNNFKAMGEFKLELQSGNAQFGSKSTISCLVLPWNFTDYLENQ